MSFFEELEKEGKRRGYEPSEENPNKFTRRLYNSGVGCGAHQVIEALKEMVVGRPIEAIVEHEIHQDTEDSRTEEWTTINSHPLYLDRYAECGFSGHYGTDGEEVSVIVVRRGGGAQRGLDAHKTYVPPTVPHQNEDKR